MLPSYETPLGVTVLACLYFLVAFSFLLTLIPSQTFNPLQHPRLLALSVACLIIAITLGIALLKMKNWSRWLAIAFSRLRSCCPCYTKLP